MGEEFIVTTEAFTGPMDLLLQLIEKRKLFIGDISLAEVTDDYLEHIQELTDFPVENVAQFLVIAATLVLVKSRSLLPYLELTEEETTDVEDLKRRLALYKEIRDLSKYISERFGKEICFAREPRTLMAPVFAPHAEITQKNLYSAVTDLISTFPEIDTTPHVAVEKVMSLEEMIDTLKGRIQDGINTSFKELAGVEGAAGREQKLNIIVSFLALLELVKENMVAVQQSALFEDIAIAKEQL